MARALDTLSVSIDAASLSEVQLHAHAGTNLGTETETLVFAQGEARPLVERRDRGLTGTWDFAANTWTTSHDGVPARGAKYVVEMQIVVYETDVDPALGADPHTGLFNALWTATLRQAEE